jgi:hypothetical protein
VEGIHRLHLGLPPAWSASLQSSSFSALASGSTTIFAQGSFALVTLLTFTATTSPCARPVASLLLFGGLPYRRCPCRLLHPRLVNRSFPTLSYSSFLKCHALYTGGSASALDQFFLADCGLRSTLRARLSASPHQRLLVRPNFRYGRHSLML